MIVFPEDGIFGLNMNRSTIYEYLELVQDPQKYIENPCLDTIPTARNRIQRRLSCAARWYQIYIVVNFGTVEFCKDKQSCPPDGRFQFNTDVVFDSDGAIVARYHKQSLFYEDQFDVPSKVEHIIFDSPLGTFGVFTCFDILFDDPALFLIESIGVVNVAFPTAWINKMPEMFTLGIHEGFAIRMGVNLLAAEIHIPEFDLQGSAIYSSNYGALTYYNNNKFLSGGKLLIADVKTPPMGPPEGNIILPKVRPVTLTFSAVMQKNLFKFVEIDKSIMDGNIYIEINNTKCFLSYSVAKEINSSEIYAFGIFEGLHHSDLNSYIQVCALVRCANMSRSSCGQPTRNAFTVFDTLRLTGQFSTNYIFPSLLIDGANPSKQDWDFLLDKSGRRGQIQSTTLKKPLLFSMLYTRVYSKDKNDNFTAYKMWHKEDQFYKWNINMKISSPEEGKTSTARFFGIVGGITGFVTVIILVVRCKTRRKPGYIKL